MIVREQLEQLARGQHRRAADVQPGRGGVEQLVRDDGDHRHAQSGVSREGRTRRGGASARSPILLTVSLAVFTLISFALVMLGPMLTDYVGGRLHLGPGFAWTWTIAQWLIIFVLFVTPLGWIYYFAPDADRPWMWITPGSIAATVLWMLAIARIQVVRRPFRGVSKDVTAPSEA